MAKKITIIFFDDLTEFSALYFLRKRTKKASILFIETYCGHSKFALKTLQNFLPGFGDGVNTTLSRDLSDEDYSYMKRHAVLVDK